MINKKSLLFYAFAIAMVLCLTKKVHPANSYFGIGEDKYTHFGMTYALTDVAVWVMDNPENTEMQRLGFGLSVGLASAGGKELYDVMRGAPFDWNDFGASALGMGLCLSLNIKWKDVVAITPVRGGIKVSLAWN